MDIPNFSDYVTQKTLDGDKLKIEDILDRPIVVTGIRVRDSKYYSKRGSACCTTLQFYFEDDPMETKHIVFSGSNVIKEQAEEINEQLEEKGLPCIFKTTVKNIGNYHSLT